MTTEPLTCRDLEILLCDYVDGVLEGAPKAAVEKHLGACAQCTELAGDASAAVAFIQHVPDVEPPDELITELLFHIAAAKPESGIGGLRAFFSRWAQPILQPRFAMGMAMTILSFSLLGRVAGIPDRPLTADDLRPSSVYGAVSDRFHRTYDRFVKYYESLRVVYEIQSRLSEWTAEIKSRETEEQPSLRSPAEGSLDADERKTRP